MAVKFTKSKPVAAETNGNGARRAAESATAVIERPESTPRTPTPIPEHIQDRPDPASRTPDPILSRAPAKPEPPPEAIGATRDRVPTKPEPAPESLATLQDQATSMETEWQTLLEKVKVSQSNWLVPIVTPTAPLPFANIGVILPGSPTAIELELQEAWKKAATLEQAIKDDTANRAVVEEEAKKARVALLRIQSIILDIAHLRNRVHADAYALLQTSVTFRDHFAQGRVHTGYVVAIDIRRSTELMLKARTPELFAKFVSGLCVDLGKIIVDSYGVFDKFTGDGILAFFPSFYSGRDAGYHAVNVAQRCHRAFSEHYRRSRSAFNSILTDVGLGIGIDYGELSLVILQGALTVVGAPVVYACRMGGAPVGATLLNQPAYDEISTKYPGHFTFDETELALKYEGPTLAYRVRRADRPHTPVAPDWLAAVREPLPSAPQVQVGEQRRRTEDAPIAMQEPMQVALREPMKM